MKRFIWIFLLFFSVGATAMIAREDSARPEMPIMPEKPNVKMPDLSGIPEMSDDEIEEAKSYLESLDPEALEMLEELKIRNEHRYRVRLFAALARKHAMESVKESNREMYEILKERQKLEIGTEKLTRKIDQLSQEHRVKIREKLEINLEKMFDLREKERQFEMQKLETRMEELRASMEERLSKKEEIIEKRMKEMMRVHEKQAEKLEELEELKELEKSNEPLH